MVSDVLGLQEGQ